MGIQFLDKLSIEQIKDQTLQVLNYSLNTLGQDSYNLSSLVSNFSYILRDKVNNDFNTSLENSINCIVDSTRYLDNIHNLVSNDNNSFILAPLLTEKHLFSTLIYKKDDLFEFVLINKSRRLKNHSYQKYTLSEEDLKSVINYLGFGEKKYCTLSEMYKVFDDNSIQKEALLNIKSNPQKEGNCFFKEIEAALKFAYSNAYVKVFKTPKWPMDTGLVHAKFILNLEKECLALKNFFKYTNSVYLKNKTFRKLCKVTKKQGNVQDYQKQEVYFKQIYDISDKSPSTGLALLDLQTLSENYSFVYRFCKQHNLARHTKALDDILPLINNEVDLKNLVPTLSNCSKIFPNVSQQLRIQYSNYLSHLADEKTLEGKLIEVKGILDKAIELNPKNAPAYVKRAFYFKKFKIFHNASVDLKRALTLSPNNVAYLSMHASVLIQLDKIDEAKVALSKLTSIAPGDKHTKKVEKELQSKCKCLNNEPVL